MTGELENSSCPTCGGQLHTGLATIPFLLSEEKVIVIKGVPSETCGDCHEPFMSGKVSDSIDKVKYHFCITTASPPGIEGVATDISITRRYLH
jgi:YgiT-type zinc finger domain-containing protein